MFKKIKRFLPKRFGRKEEKKKYKKFKDTVRPRSIEKVIEELEKLGENPQFLDVKETLDRLLANHLDLNVNDLAYLFLENAMQKIKELDELILNTNITKEHISYYSNEIWRWNKYANALFRLWPKYSPYPNVPQHFERMSAEITREGHKVIQKGLGMR